MRDDATLSQHFGVRPPPHVGGGGGEFLASISTSAGVGMAVTARKNEAATKTVVESILDINLSVIDLNRR